MAVRDRPPITVRNSPWVTLGVRRFGGERYECLITLQTDSQSLQTTVRLIATSSDAFDISVSSPIGEVVYNAVSVSLADPAILLCTLDGAKLRTTIVSQPPPSIPPSSSASTSIAERLHIFHDGYKKTILLPSPMWLRGKARARLSAETGGIRAPMPSLVVEVKVNSGDKVKMGQPIVILESMKTETVLRADKNGTVKSVGCKKGEMVEEGRDLVEIDFEETF